MYDPRLHAVGPVIGQDLEVALIFEGNGADDVESGTGFWRRAGERSPHQAAPHDVVRDGAVGRLDVAGPYDVAAEIGGFALEEVEVIVCWAISLTNPNVTNWCCWWWGWVVDEWCGTDDDFEILPCLQVKFLVCGGQYRAVDGGEVEWWRLIHGVERRNHSPGWSVLK